MHAVKPDQPKTLFSWCLYDWANSVFSLVITSTLFPVYYGLATASPDGAGEVDFFGFSVLGSALYSFAVSASFLLAGLLSPFLSALADLGGYRRIFLMAFCLLGSVSSALLYFFTPGNTETGILLFVLGNLGFSGSIVFYNSFLPEIASTGKLESVSARGFAFGYIGSVVLLILVLLPLFVTGFPGSGDFAMICRYGFIWTGLWWMGFGFLSVSGLPGKEKGLRPNLSITSVLKRMQVAKEEIQTIKGLALFLTGFFFMNTGVQTVMYLAAVFGDAELHLSSEKLIATILILQLVAIGGSLLFARMSHKIRPASTLVLAAGLWALICLLAYFVETDIQFYGLAAMVGLVMGGSQSMLRSTFSHFIPGAEIGKSALFGFFDVLEKFSIVLGTFTFGIIHQVTGSMRSSALALIVFFIAGMWLFGRLKGTESKGGYRV